MRLALFQPDIPQNTGAAMRLCACMDTGMDIIEPCGFPWDERKIRRSGMDYIESLDLQRFASWDAFTAARAGQRVILLTTAGDAAYTGFTFAPDDILMLGRESAGVPDDIHNSADARLYIPMRAGMRSLNVINAAAMVLGEALRQTGQFPPAT